MAKKIPLSHQEKWDGSGYPQGLKGEDIPLSARLMAMADVFDALISKRVYKEAMPVDQALEIMINGKGKHFDPELIDALLEIQDQLIEIASRYRDTDEALADEQAQIERFQ